MSGAIFCLSLYHVCPAHSRKSVGSAGLHFGALSEEYPIWNDFLTFSTGFSTGIVKKAPVFPRCFPLFPLSFPHFPVKRFIHGVLYRADLCENQGNYGPLHLFSERKSNPKIYFLQHKLTPDSDCNKLLFSTERPVFFCFSLQKGSISGIFFIKESPSLSEKDGPSGKLCAYRALT